MNREQLFEAIGEINEVYITNDRAKKKKPRPIYRFAAMAACLCLMLTGTLYSMNRLGYFGAKCSANPGTIVDGVYYFSVDHSGIYAYDGSGAPEKVLGAWWVEDWSVNDYGVYYSCGRTFGVVPHETGKRQVLYRSGLFTSSFVRHQLQKDGTVLLTLYKIGEGAQEILTLDGRTGEVLSSSLPETNGAWPTHFQVGERQIDLVRTGVEYCFDVQENGVSLLPEGMSVREYSALYIGEALRFYCAYPERWKSGTMLLLRPDGEDKILEISANHYYNTGTADILMDVQYAEGDYEVWCLDTMTNETWPLTVGDGPTIYSIESDGEMVYACVPWDDYQSQWKVVRDENGRPAALALVDENILE